MSQKGMLAVLAAVTCLVASGDETLFPLDGTKAQDLCGGKVVVGPAGADVQVAPDQPWSGVAFILAKSVDLVNAGGLVVLVSNVTDRPLPLNVHAKTLGAPENPLAGNRTLKAHEAGEIEVSVVTKAHSLGVALPGMRAYEDEPGKGRLDIRKIGNINVFRSRQSEPASFRVLSIFTRNLGVTVPKPPTVGKDFFPMVDRYGQFKHGEWPGKVHSDAELFAARDHEDAELAAAESPIPDADRFGGWAKGPQLKATGFFRVEKVGGKWWYVDPDGHLFYSHGIDCVHAGETTGTSRREHFFEWLPSADDRTFALCCGRNSWPAAHGFYSKTNNVPYETFDFALANHVRLYGKKFWTAFHDRAHRRLRAWGMNTIGNWSDRDACRLDRTPYVATVYTGGFAKKLPRSKGWWGPLPDFYDAGYPEHVQRQVKAVAKRVKDDPWCLGVFVDNEMSWNDEPDTLKAAERYFTIVSETMKRELPNHLYLGCRFMAHAGPGMYRIAAKYCDVVSVNIYSKVPKVDYPSDAVDRPIQVGEFHFGALDRGLFHTGLVPVANQAERADAYRRYQHAAIDDPRMIGAHWFQYRDQAFSGRSDSECYQIGFTSVVDVPYPEMVEAARDVARTMYGRRFGR